MDATDYAPQGHGTLGKLFDSVLHRSNWDLPSSYFFLVLSDNRRCATICC
jgi:hypothetical protein